MNIIFRESGGLDEIDLPVDLEQDPAELVVLSFSDSDLGAFSAGWHSADGGLPPLRLANLASLRHPLSVDTYVERTLEGARAILVRLIGGVPYWEYGLAEIEALARRRGIALAVLPADRRPDPRLDAVSTVPHAALRRLTALCDAGGAASAREALAELARLGRASSILLSPASVVDGAETVEAPATSGLAMFGEWAPPNGWRHADGATREGGAVQVKDPPRVLLVFYRAFLAAADTEPVEALGAALEARGIEVRGAFVPSLKAPEAAAWLEAHARELGPAAIVNVTAFSARRDDGASPLDAAGVPVFQVALATSNRADWHGSARGLSPADLAMHVVLPEVDGRVFAGVASFKEAGERDAALQFSRPLHTSDPERIASIAARVTAWVRLARVAPADKRIALVLSTYPGHAERMAHAVGLDAIASAEAMLEDLAEAGHAVERGVEPGHDLVHALRHETLDWPLADYRRALESLPSALRESLHSVWGRPEDDPACRDGSFRFAATRRGGSLVALQPERGDPALRIDSYHDLEQAPRHGYVAFHLWLRHGLRLHALVHIGAHGTLEWLPGKAVALSGECWPEALVGPLPVLYPFIANDPGEAAQAKRRLGALALGHVPPPMRSSGTPHRLARLEALLDEFSTADGLDPRRRERLPADIREEARAAGVEGDLGLAASADTEEAIDRIDRFVCDVKEGQFGDGLHVWGRRDVGGGTERAAGSVAEPVAGRAASVPSAEAFAEAAAAERAGLIDALAGRRIAPGPSGSPWRGRADVLPTGRNLYTIDPRAVPTRAAHAQGVRLAEELLRRHLQDQGDFPASLVVDLWGSATMRTAGEEFAMALHLVGAVPVWDESSGRVRGVDVVELEALGRPRVDVTLRVSGIFRDVFPTLSSLFGQVVRALATRQTEGTPNPCAGGGTGARVYGPAPGTYGVALGDPFRRADPGMGAMPDIDVAAERDRAGDAWLRASSHALDGAEAVPDRAGIEARVREAAAFVHPQDLPETDLLLAADYAAHEAGFAAASERLGGRAALYHLDNTDPASPRARALSEEIARVVRARAANPDWATGMMRHGFRGAAEISATLDHLASFAVLTDAVGSHLFDLYHEATLGRDDLREFMERENPDALEALRERFGMLLRAGRWRTRSNSILADFPEHA